MPLLEEIILLLTAVGVSVVLASILRLPVALLQVLCGLLLAPCVHAATITDPELFLLLFVAPLLFVDAYLAPGKELFRFSGTIAWMAVGLVIFTVVAGGLILHWLLPGMPLAMSFALAAVLAPTDAVALSSSSRGVALFRPLAHILEGEALLNDATALVCFRVALVAAVTGSFSWTSALASFFIVGLGGILIGTAVALAMAQVELLIQRSAGPQPSSQVLLGLLLPFGTFLVAERLHCSGILASVTAGLVSAWRVKERMAPETSAHGIQIFEMLRTASNGLIFLFLGARLPIIARGLDMHLLPSFATLGLYVLITVACLTVLRILWALPVIGQFRRRAAFPSELSSAGLLAFFGIAGLRGALTMASILSLPLQTSSGSPLPGREISIVLATGVILCSLVTAPLLLPRFARLVAGEREPTPSPSPSPSHPALLQSGTTV